MAEGSYRRGVALFEYRAVESDELSFHRGDTIVIFGSSHEGFAYFFLISLLFYHDSGVPSWFEGELNGRVGLCPANYLRLDVNAPDFSAHVRGHQPAMPSNQETVSPVHVPSAMVQEETSASTMCVLSQDNETKRIFERLYETGITHVKKKLENQEAKKAQEAQAMKGIQFKAGHKSAILAKKARKKADVEIYAHCGEYLYHEGLKAKHFKAEKARMILHQRRMEELSCQFKPEINDVSKKLRRDMPVVQKLTMYEQIKQEKLDGLRKSKEQEESKSMSFTPTILKYNLKEDRQRIWSAQHQHATQEWHHERNSRLEDLREKFKLERGLTHKPSIDENSRQLAASTSGGETSDDVFQKLHRDAEKRSLKSEARKIEARLWSLDLARNLKDPPITPRGISTPRDTSSSRVSLHEDAAMRRLRKLFLEKQTAASESMARNNPKIAPKSEQLSRDRLRKDCRSVLEALLAPDGHDQVHYTNFFEAIDGLVDFTLVSSDLTDLSREEKEVLIDRIWNVISGAPLEDRKAGFKPVHLDKLLDEAMKIQSGKEISFDDAEPKEVGKAAMGVFEEFVRIVMWKKLSTHPAHLSRQKEEKLEMRIKYLMDEANREFAVLLRRCGVKVNDVECKALFSYFDIEGMHNLDYLRFSKEVNNILSPRRRAIVRMMKTIESQDGSVFLSDFVLRADTLNPSKCASSKLQDTLSTISELRRRLREGSGVHNPGREAKTVGGGERSSAGSPSQQCQGSLDVSSSSQESVIGLDVHHDVVHQIPDGAPMPPTRRKQQNKNLDFGDRLPRHVYLHQLSRKWLENRFSARQMQDEKEMEHCTFRPQINASQANKVRNEPIGERLYDLAKSKDALSDHESSWERRQQQECTFHPVINKFRPSSAPAKQSETKLVSEMKHVQRVRQKYSDDTLSPNPVHNETSSGFGSAVHGHKTMKPFKDHRQSGHVPDSPMIMVEVNLHGGKIGRISVQQGDDPSLLARNFCKAYDLSPSSESRLAEMLAEQMAGLEVSP